jgi:hypothetical protein
LPKNPCPCRLPNHLIPKGSKQAHGMAQKQKMEI